MRTFKLFVLIIFCFLILTKLSYSNDKIAILDIDSLLERTTYGKNIINELNIINENNLKSLKKIENKIKLDQESLKSQKNLLSEEELNIKINKLNSDIKEFQIKKKNLVNDFNKKKNDKLDQFFKIILPEIEKYINENNINLVLDKKNIFIANRNNNITDEVVKIIDEKIK